MSTYFAPGCKNDKAHICDFCEIDDGRPTFYWEDKDFDLCFACILNLNKQIPNQEQPIIVLSRIIIPEALRNKVFERDNYTCRICGRTGIKLTIDHIIPFTKGGKTIITNLQTLCTSCNSKKGYR